MSNPWSLGTYSVASTIFTRHGTRASVRFCRSELEAAVDTAIHSSHSQLPCRIVAGGCGGGSLSSSCLVAHRKKQALRDPKIVLDYYISFNWAK
jgi:hypothetical protein